MLEKSSSALNFVFSICSPLRRMLRQIRMRKILVINPAPLPMKKRVMRSFRVKGKQSRALSLDFNR